MVMRTFSNGLSTGSSATRAPGAHEEDDVALAIVKKRSGRGIRLVLGKEGHFSNPQKSGSVTHDPKPIGSTSPPRPSDVLAGPG